MSERNRLSLLNIWTACDLKTWLSIVRQTKGQPLLWQSRIVIAAILCISAFNSVLGWIQRLVYSRRIKHCKPKSPLFVLGHWRSATTVLQQILSADPQFGFASSYACFCPHHFLLTERMFADDFNALAPTTRVIDDLVLDASGPQEDEFALLGLGAPSPYRLLATPSNGFDLVSQLRSAEMSASQESDFIEKLQWFLKALTVRCPQRLVLKSPAHTMRWRTLLRMYPNAQFVVITRERDATIASAVTMWSKLLNHTSLTVVDHDELQRNLWRRSCDSFDAFSKSIQKARQSLPASQLHVIDFDEMLYDPVGQLQHLYAAFDLGPFRIHDPATARLLSQIKRHQPQLHRTTVGRA
ncbi:sulfotransferase family protein [Novipirellula artificiosorum]|uniref:Sulfotransferase domain protein n=1 Tax=Novipirellula artificiosorum TaxID=2528016 RepID=A0A5C6D6H9_9BACT|nr:sulfotransferase [Novipirellula artificiosorum]TWU31317.1 hypothetical protein Poly41_61860 [Novipirellula artificiosorum]